MAHKKAAWSAKNLRDSKPKYRWVKLFWWQKVVAGNVIVRQKWNKFEPWKNTYLWKDFSIHAKIDGLVSFSKKNKIRFDGRKYLKTIVNVLWNTQVADNTKASEGKSTAVAKKAKSDSATKSTTKTAVKKSAAKTVKKTPTKKTPAKNPTSTTKKTSAKKAATKK